jgi:putative heme iron utilization protein
MSDSQAKRPFSAEEVRQMVDHMNEDHADSVLAYARHFAGRADSITARLLDVTPTEMHLIAETPSGPENLLIHFDHRLESGHDAHMTMVKMSKKAKRALHHGSSGST